MNQFLKPFGVFFLFILISCNSGYKPTAYTSELIAINRFYTGTEAVDSLIAPYKIKIQEETNRVIGHSKQTLVKGKPESLLTNFASDLLLVNSKIIADANSIKKIDIAFVNNGGLRTAIPQGDITIGDIYKLMPFENKITILGMSGKTLNQFLDLVASEGGEGLSGVSFGIKDNVAINIKISGEPLDISKNYYMVTSDYLANGGGGDMLKDAFFRYDDALLFRDMIINHIEKLNANNQMIESQLDQRIYEVK